MTEPLLLAFMMSLQATLWHSVIIPKMVKCWHPKRKWRALSACWQGGHWRLVDILKRTACFWLRWVPVWPARVANRTSPAWLLPNLSADELQSCPRPNAICNKKWPSKGLTGYKPFTLGYPPPWSHYCDDTGPEQQLARASEQHTRLKHAFAQQCHKVCLHIIIIKVKGTI